MVLPWRQIWCQPHIHACGAPWWMVYFPSCPLIPRIFFKSSLDPQISPITAANTSLMYTSPGHGSFPFFNNNFWYTPSFLLKFVCLLTTTMSLVLNYLIIFYLLCSSLSLSLISDIKGLDSSVCLNRSKDAASK